ncbi:MAG: murein hydrolase activator EnvC family protein [Chakrabartia godavariana]
MTGVALAVAGALLASGASGQSVEQRQRELASAKAQAERAQRQAQALEDRAQTESDAAEQVQVQSAALAARIQAIEAEIVEAQARVALVEKMREQLRNRLAEKQRPAVRLAAALQTMASRPPAMALVQPGTTSDLVHVRMLLAGLAPQIRARTEGLKADLEESRRLKQDAVKALQLLADGRKRLNENRAALVRLEAQHRQASARLASSALAEQDRALALGEKARDIVDLIDELGVQSATRGSLESLPGPLLRPSRPGAVMTLPSDAATVGTARLDYRLPVTGQLVTGLGEVSKAGVRARGLTLRTPPQAQVAAPHAGRVVFAGPFKGYGQIVILDHGDGWTSLVTDMATLSVRVGETVIQGSPIGRTGSGAPRVTVELRRGGRPVDITPMIG